jgi:hypothetical protein
VTPSLGFAQRPAVTGSILGGRTLAGPMGRGVPRQESAVHFDGRQPTGRVRRVDLEGTVAGSRGFSSRRGLCPTGTGAIAG